MAFSDLEIMGICNDYTDETVLGGGAIKGKNCTIQSITDITGGHEVTFKWTLDDGTEQTATMDVMDGKTFPSGMYNVLDHGLVGDGTTDNTEALQALVDDVPSGAVIYFPSGVYGISAGIEINKSLAFLGATHKINTRTAGPQDSVIKYIGDDDNVSMFYRSVVTDVSFENLSFDGDSFTIAQNTAAFESLPYPLYVETAAHDNINGLDLAFQKDSGNSTVKNCMFYGFSGFAVSQGRYKMVIDCGFQKCATCIQAMLDSEVHNCYISVCGTAVKLAKADSGASQWVSINISDCWVDQMSRHFVESPDATTAVIMTDNVWVDMVDSSAFYFPKASVTKSKIHGHFGRIGMMYAGLQTSARTEEIAKDSDFFYAKLFSASTFDIDVGETLVGVGNNASAKCTSRYLYPVNWSINNCIINAPELVISDIVGKGAAYNTKVNCYDGLITLSSKLQFLNGTAFGTGSPVGVSGYTAPSAGYFYFDTTNKIMYLSTAGSDNTAWEALS